MGEVPGEAGEDGLAGRVEWALAAVPTGGRGEAVFLPGRDLRTAHTLGAFLGKF